MRLKYLNITLSTYGPNEGKYTGEAKFANQSGAIDIVLVPEVSDKILALCAEALVANAREVAQNLTAATLTQVSSPVLEHKG